MTFKIRKTSWNRTGVASACAASGRGGSGGGDLRRPNGYSGRDRRWCVSAALAISHASRRCDGLPRTQVPRLAEDRIACCHALVPLSLLPLQLTICALAAATPLAVKHEKEQPDSAEGVSPEGGRRTSHSGTAESPHGKENSDAIHRLGILHAGKDSSPNTAAAEASAIAGMFALTQGLSRSVDFQEGTDDAIEKDDDEGCGDDAGDDAQASGSESSSRGVAASTSSQEECAAGALMAMGFAQVSATEVTAKGVCR